MDSPTLIVLGAYKHGALKPKARALRDASACLLKHSRNAGYLPLQTSFSAITTRANIRKRQLIPTYCTYTPGNLHGSHWNDRSRSPSRATPRQKAHTNTTMSDLNDHAFESMPAELLAAMLKAAANDDEKLAADSSHLPQIAADNTSSFASLSSPRASQSNSQGEGGEKDEGGIAMLSALAKWMQRGGTSSSSGDGGSEPPGFRKHALEHAPCANVRAAEGWKCSNTTNLKECANCHLVSYCSKECQRQHWPTHKQDCKDPICANDWKPKWVLQKRSPTFIGASQGPWFESIEPLGLGIALWGNNPAQDILNYSMNENDSSRDLDLAFVASGDLRNVLETVNQLPTEYTGKLTIVINDHNPFVAIRNMLLLQLLCNAVDQQRGCDIALHVWYSTFIPDDYAAQLHSSLLSTLLDLSANDGVHRFDLGDSGASLSVAISKKSMQLACEIANPSTYDITEASKEVHRVRFAPSRVDRHDRGYCRMEPSHRLACLEFRRFGLVLPFGAANNWFNTPNRTLFSPAGRWLQNDLADPLDSWDPVQVVAAGKRHGIPSADLYGCLYFFLSEKLEEFSSRIARFKVSFKILDQNLLTLPSTIRSGELERVGLLAGQRFDRVDVSNAMDKQYAGVRATLMKCGPMLKDTAHAAIVGYFMNWAADNEGGRPGEKEISSLIDRALKEGKIPSGPKGASTATQLAWGMTLPAFFNNFNALHDNSKGFENYLSSEELEAVLRCSGLRRRLEHTISPHRLYAPLKAPRTTLPIFPDQETWYLRANIGAPMWSERFVEFTKA